VAYAQAAGMPMAVPVNCSQNVWPKENMLFIITISRISRNRVPGKVCGILSELTCIKSRIDFIACWVLMLVYIKTASAKNRSVLPGMFKCFESCITVVDFLCRS
jgi:hypothetical protein